MSVLPLALLITVFSIGLGWVTIDYLFPRNKVDRH